MLFKKRNSRPTAEEAARRLVILKHVVVSALTAPPRDLVRQMLERFGAEEREQFKREAEVQRDTFWGELRAVGLWRDLSPAERTLAQSTLVTMTEQQQTDASWRMEAVQIILWALNFLPELPTYDALASHDLLKQIPSEDIAAFLRSVRLRDGVEIERARDAAELWHWRGRTRGLIERGDAFPASGKMKALGFHSYDDIVRFTAKNAEQNGSIPPCIDEDFPVGGKAYRDLDDQSWSEVRSVSAERHFALNWLCGHAPGNRWDDTPTDT